MKGKIFTLTNLFLLIMSIIFFVGLMNLIELLVMNQYSINVKGKNLMEITKEERSLNTFQSYSSGTSKKKVIVAIDAGHGGYDPGSIGFKGTME